jgi:hypothetical protein
MTKPALIGRYLTPQISAVSSSSLPAGGDSAINDLALLEAGVVEGVPTFAIVAVCRAVAVVIAVARVLGVSVSFTLALAVIGAAGACAITTLVVSLAAFVFARGVFATTTGGSGAAAAWGTLTTFAAVCAISTLWTFSGSTFSGSTLSTRTITTRLESP